METNTNGAGMKKIFISAIIAMLLINGVTLYFLLNEKQEKQAVTAQNNTLQQDFESVTAVLDSERISMEGLKGKNAAMDKLISEKENAIDQVKNELAQQYANNKLTTAELNKARRMIAQDEISIASLQTELADYKEQTHQLTGEKEQLSADLSCEQEDNTKLTDVKDSLNKKVDAGSILQIAKVDVEAVRMKHNGKEVPVDKAKVAENLKVSFETGVNKVIDPGKLSLYVRIVNPRGETLAVTERGSGTIPDMQSGKPVQYTKKADISYNQTNKKVVLYWNSNINNPGLYRVEVYQSGHVIGKGEVRLT